MFYQRRCAKSKYNFRRFRCLVKMKKYFKLLLVCCILSMFLYKQTIPLLCIWLMVMTSWWKDDLHNVCLHAPLSCPLFLTRKKWNAALKKSSVFTSKYTAYHSKYPKRKCVLLQLTTHLLNNKFQQMEAAQTLVGFGYISFEFSSDSCFPHCSAWPLHTEFSGGKTCFLE